jgi:hypothetical protein
MLACYADNNVEAGCCASCQQHTYDILDQMGMMGNITSLTTNIRTGSYGGCPSTTTVEVSNSGSSYTSLLSYSSVGTVAMFKYFTNVGVYRYVRLSTTACFLSQTYIMVRLIPLRSSSELRGSLLAYPSTFGPHCFPSPLCKCHCLRALSTGEPSMEPKRRSYRRQHYAGREEALGHGE